MFLFDLFRSFLPQQNPIGFGVVDFLEFGIAALLVALFFAHGWVEPILRRFSTQTGWCMLALAALPVLLRLALLPHHPVPTPNIADEFGHLFVADTLRHFRLANPTHPLHQFFETFFILQEPTFSSIYPLGQGIALALGRLLFGVPWAGVVLATAAFCALCYWMLRAWTTPLWALLGGLLAAMQFGPLSQWMNTYWGGEFAAAAGCLVFGALPRLRDSGRIRDGVALGVGLAIHLLTRPYESIFLLIAVVLFLMPAFRLRLRPLVVSALVVVPVIVLTLAQNKQVTSSFATFPYALGQYQYGVPAALTFQPQATPHRDLTPQQELEYQVQRSFRNGAETPASYFTRLLYRVRYYRFFFLAPLYLAIPAFLLTMRRYRFVWVALTLILFAMGINFFPAFQFHYLAGVTCLFVLVSIKGLEEIGRWNVEAARVIVFLCLIQFAFWYTLHLFDDSEVSLAARQFETWNAINHRNPERRIAVREQMAKTSGKQLVFVRYHPNHVPQDEWVWNEASLDESRVVLARDRGAVENAKLRHYYPDRNVLLLEPDFRPMPRISAYSEETESQPVSAPQRSPFEEVK